MTTKIKTLSRFDIRRRHDRATKAVVLEYTGRGLSWHRTLYGYPDGVFFTVSESAIPYPPELLRLADELGVVPDLCDGARSLREAALEAIIAGALVDAPMHIADLAEPAAEWKAWDQRELERKHAVALACLADRIALVERELRLRARPVRLDRWAVPPEPPPAPPEVLPELLPTPEIEPVAIPPLPSDATVTRIEPAIAMARENELPQRLPGGARRHLAKMVRAQYIVRDAAVPESRVSLAEAMRDAEKIAASDGVEVAVIDWDGEWPVVVRRYGTSGRAIYRVEDALRRAGIATQEEHAA